MRNPILIFISFFLTGILAAGKMEILIVNLAIILNIFFLLIALVFLIFLRENKNFFKIGLCIFFFFLGVFRYASAVNSTKDDISNFIPTFQDKVLICGTVMSEPQWRQTFRGQRITFILDADRIFVKEKEYSIVEKVYVNFLRPRKVPLVGDRIVLSGKVSFPALRGVSYGFNQKKYLNRMGIKLVMFSEGNDIYFDLGLQKNPLILARRFLSKLRIKSGYLISRYLYGAEGAITESLVIGERSKIPPEIIDIFIKTGTMHILSVSGLHVGVVAVIIMWLLRLIRCHKVLMYLLTIFGICSYSVFTGASPPAIRASLMGTFMILGVLLGRKSDITGSIFLSAFLITFFQPGQFFRPAFILSYLAVLSIIYVAPFVEASLGVKNSMEKGFASVGKYLTKSLTISCGVWMGMMPVIASYFLVITPSVVLANILAIPVFFLILVFGFGLLITGSIGFLLPMAKIVSALLTLAISCFIKSMEFISQIPFSSMSVSPPCVAFLIIFYIILALVILVYGKQKSRILLPILVLFTANFFVWNEILCEWNGK